jgi:glycosyltransferase involved in cell wall biosynthesis
VKIAQVVASYHPQIGGIETHVLRLARGLAEAGDHVTVVTHHVQGTPTDEWIGPVRVLRFPFTMRSRNYPLSLGLFRYLKEYASDFDLIHAHNYHTLVGHAAIGRHPPFIFTPHYHGTGHSGFRAILHQLYRPAGARLFAAADAVVCVSEAERDRVVIDFPDVASKVVTIPNGTDPKQRVSGQERITLDGPIVLTVGRLERYKNVDLIIDAFRALPTSATLVVVGVRDSLFAQAGVVTSASDHEAFGLSLAEGLASGARVVASGIPAHVALGRLAGETAPVTLVDPRNTRKFTDSLATSLSAGQHWTSDLKLPSWVQVVEKTRELYWQVCSQGGLGSQRIL